MVPPSTLRPRSSALRFFPWSRDQVARRTGTSKSMCLRPRRLQVSDGGALARDRGDRRRTDSERSHPSPLRTFPARRTLVEGEPRPWAWRVLEAGSPSFETLLALGPWDIEGAEGTSKDIGPSLSIPAGSISASLSLVVQGHSNSSRSRHHAGTTSDLMSKPATDVYSEVTAHRPARSARALGAR